MRQYPWATILDHCTFTEWQWEELGNDEWGLCTIVHPDENTTQLIVITNDPKTSVIDPTERVWVESFNLPNLSTSITLEPYENMGELIRNIGYPIGNTPR